MIRPLVSSPRKRVLFIAEAVTLAHVARPLVLAQRLDPQQYEIHFACAGQNDFPLHSTPFRRWTIHSNTPEQFRTALDAGRPVYDFPTLCRYVEDDLDLLRQVQPDLVVGDFRLSLAASAKLAQVPYATITNAYWTPQAQVRYTIPEHAAARWLGVPAANVLFRGLRPAIFALHSIPMHRVMKRYGLPSLGADLRRVYTQADWVLLADIPELARLGAKPENHHFVGPLLWSPQVHLPAWWDHLPADKPLVYVTLGSSGYSSLLQTVLEGLAQLDVRVIAATAGRTLLDRVPGNASVADYLPGCEAAQRASLVICNGGSPTTYQALAAGKPVLGIPNNLDQHLNMQGLVAAGVARMMRPHQATAQAIRRQAQLMLEQGCPAAESLQDAIKRCPTPDLGKLLHIEDCRPTSDAAAKASLAASGSKP